MRAVSTSLSSRPASSLAATTSRNTEMLRSAASSSPLSSSSVARSVARAIMRGRSTCWSSSTSQTDAPRRRRAMKSASERASVPGSVMYIPRPWRTSTSPRAERSRTASRTTARLTANCSASSGSVGSASPGESSPRRTDCLMLSATCCASVRFCRDVLNTFTPGFARINAQIQNQG